MQVFLSANCMCVYRGLEFLFALACGIRLGQTAAPAAAGLLGHSGHPTCRPSCAALLGCPACLLRPCRFNFLLPVLHPVPPVPRRRPPPQAAPQPARAEAGGARGAQASRPGGAAAGKQKASLHAGWGRGSQTRGLRMGRCSGSRAFPPPGSSMQHACALFGNFELASAALCPVASRRV